LCFTLPMTPRDIIELAWQRFRTRSLRFLLTVSGVGIAIGVVFFLVTLGFGLQEVVIGRISTSESLLSLTVTVADQAEALFHTRVLEYYGSTETGAIAARRQAEADVWRCFDGVRVRVAPSGFRVDADYFPEPVVLSDVVEIKSPTEFLLLGRDSDMIKIGGKRSSLVHLNQQLSEIEGVLDGAFFLAEAQEAREPRLAAFVVAPGRTRAEILDALRRRMDEVFLPRHLHLVAALPRSTTGKLPRENLLRLLRAETEKNGASAERQSNGETTDEHG